MLKSWLPNGRVGPSRRGGILGRFKGSQRHMHNAEWKTSSGAKKEEPKHVALRYILDAWEEALFDGIDSDCVATAAIFAALSDMIAAYGEEPVANMTERLPERIRAGEFTIATAEIGAGRSASEAVLIDDSDRTVDSRVAINVRDVYVVSNCSAHVTEFFRPGRCLYHSRTKRIR